MWGHKKRRREAEARELQLAAQLREERRKHAAELETERQAKLAACKQVDSLTDQLAAANTETVALAHQVADLQPAVTRLTGYVTRLKAEQPESDAAYIVTLEQRIARFSKGAGRWMAATWKARAETARAQLETREVRRAYEARLAELQAANERMTREGKAA
ncbi:hypothetical protein AB0M28_13645 [Streptomyces sp. NPDC051940]|uniref:hypothetical protein n=1 Tax=Streptomyces sp. NPDC051940 TaxID=3155675 RepID=UPI00342B682C